MDIIPTEWIKTEVDADLDIKIEIDDYMPKETLVSLEKPLETLKCLDCHTIFPTYLEFKNHRQSEHNDHQYLEEIKEKHVKSENIKEFPKVVRTYERKFKRNQGQNVAKIKTENDEILSNSITIKKEPEDIPEPIPNASLEIMQHLQHQPIDIELNLPSATLENPNFTDTDSLENDVQMQGLQNSLEDPLPTNIEIKEEVHIVDDGVYEVFHKKPEIFQCTDCKTKFDSFLRLKDHRKIYHNVCPQPFQSKTKENLGVSEQMKNEAHTPKVIRTYERKTKRKPEENILNKIKNEPMEITDTDIVIENEVHTSDEIQDQTSSAFQCIECKINFETYLEFVEHEQIQHNQQYEMVAIVDNLNESKRLMSQKPIIKKSTSNAQHACKVCNRKFKRRRYLHTHMELHGLPKYQCHFCDRKFALKTYLKAHLTRAHSTGSKVSQCGICNEMVAANEFRQHLRQAHHKKIDFPKCDICKKEFFGPHDLEKHYKTKHVLPDKYPCKICSKEFKSDTLLNDHYIEHLPHDCDMCAKRFETKGDLLRHRKHEHLKSSNHQCHICKSVFGRAVDLKNHFPVHFGSTYSCKICGKTYRRITNLLAHHESFHNDN